MKTTPGRRVECSADGVFQLEPGDYVKLPDGRFMCRVPDSALIGDLSRHTVTEHEDGTITVAPSILVTAPNVGQWHGFLERGLWREC